MQKWLIILIVFFATEQLVFSQNNDNSKEWYPFYINEPLAQSSPLNLNKSFLDPPSSKHGFLGIKNNTFIFDDGTPAIFWGTNLVYRGNFPSKQEAENLVNKIAFFGFNIVRIHNIDSYSAPGGIFKEATTTGTSKFDDKQLDLLDYLISLFEQKGIYVDLNLLVGRTFSTADGVADAAGFKPGAKPYSLFDPLLIKLQQQYASDLLSHLNPYTNKRYYDDPSIAVIEVTNENSIYALWEAERLDSDLKNFLNYNDLLDSMWKNWLIKKYKTNENIINQWGDENFKKLSTGTPPEISFIRPPRNEVYKYGPIVRKDIQQFYVGLENSYYQKMISFLKDTCHIKVPITGSSFFTNLENVAMGDNFDFIDSHAYWDHPTFPGKSWNQNHFQITDASILQDKNIGIIGRLRDLQIKYASQKPFSTTEWNHCFPNKYSYETTALFAANSRLHNWNPVFQFAFSHGFGKASSKHLIQNYFDAIANPQELILDLVGSVIEHDPKMPEITINNDYYSIKSSKAIIFCGNLKKKELNLGSFKLVPQSNGFLALISLNGDPVESSNKLALILLNGVKNSNSGWNADGKYDWGEEPTALKNYSIDLESNSESSFEIYKIADNGEIGNKIGDLNKNTDQKISSSSVGSPWFMIISPDQRSS